MSSQICYYEKVEVDILDLITFENGSELKLFVNCFNEALQVIGLFELLAAFA